MDNALADEILVILTQSYGPAEAQRISGTYLLAYNLASARRQMQLRAAQEATPPAEDGEAVSAGLKSTRAASE